MIKSTAEELRKSIEAAGVYAKAGIAFVPIPVMDDEDNNYLVSMADKRLKKMIAKEDKENKI